MIVTQRDLLCPSCGGQCLYSPAEKGLKCQSCGTVHAVEPPEGIDATAEFHYDPTLPHTEQSEIDTTRTHTCETCGGRVVFTGAMLSTQCPYCNGPVVEAPAQSAFDAYGLIPFAITETDAQARAISWIKGRIAAPNNLADLVSQGRVAGIYVPFWTFDSREAVQYTVTYSTGSGKNRRTRHKSGQMNTFFDDLLVPASHHVSPLIRDGILHDFKPEELVTYDPGFLAGFAAERHHQTVTEGLRLKAPDKDILLRNRIKHHSGVSRISHVGYKTHTSGIRYRRILLPVWILHYTYMNKPLKVVVCGLHGRTFGERPFSMWKLLGFSALAVGLTMAFGWGWGAALMP